MPSSTSDPAPAPPLLGAYAAKQCPVRLFRQYDPTETATAAPPDDELQRLFDDGLAYEAAIADQIVELHASADVARIPGRDELDHEQRRALTDAALGNHTPIILGALLQPDLDGRRRGEVDILLATGSTVSRSGLPEYRAIDIKSHRSTIDLPSEVEPVDGLGRPPIHGLYLLAPQPVAGYAPRVREDDCLQLAHYHRLLQHLGHAEPGRRGSAWGAILGMEGLVAWFDLDEPQFSTVTPQEADGKITFHKRARSTKRTALDRYDFEFAFRTRVVDAALRRSPSDAHSLDDPIVRPIKVNECERCDWRDVCDADLRAADDVSLVRGVGYPEWRVHRFVGVDTVDKLADLDVAAVAERYADTPLQPDRVINQVRCAQSLRAGSPIVKDDWDPERIPRGDLEIDIDIESDGLVYLWGARLTRVPRGWPEATGTYRAFASFDPIDASIEARLVDDFWVWLDELRSRAASERRSVRIYSYSAVEATHLRRIRPSVDVAELLSSEQWVDLLPIMKAKYWSNWGHGLKVMAAAAGFEWRDDDPGGWASVGWYRQAVAAEQAPEHRAEQIARILAYNEDDCRATAALRSAT